MELGWMYGILVLDDDGFYTFWDSHLGTKGEAIRVLADRVVAHPEKTFVLHKEEIDFAVADGTGYSA